MSSNPCTCLQPALAQGGSNQTCTTLEGRKLGLTTCWELGKKWEVPICHMRKGSDWQNRGTLCACACSAHTHCKQGRTHTPLSRSLSGVSF